ncbi:response regulator transcription factor [Nocardioides anomalus]|uniref:Response regulator transcription factor n=1 Tax=Nocardioides anomalus TaxID=2712223 RepID=A0A6G6WGS0_9ACTN|nr:LuxR C-terminal-related transcriptional regulator [Nocardioides anomalus]QIG44406.1 response regulator transcription factor [Nocardioides anomalus]
MGVASDQSLVAESVRRALHERGHGCVTLSWPAAVDDSTDLRPRLRPRSREGSAHTPQVAVLLSDLDRWGRVMAARTLVAGLPVPWLVLAGAPRGPVWGALYESGATLVLHTDTDLDTVCDAVVRLGSGSASTPGPPRELLRAWQSYAQRRRELTHRLQTLTGREEQVLHQLHQGVPVRSIAERSEVAEATVRSQVKAILRKLDVSSQIAAVAAYQEVQSINSRATQVEVLEAMSEPVP